MPSRSRSGSAFSQQRKEWTALAAPLFRERYKEFFGVDSAAIHDVEGAIEATYDADAPIDRRIIQMVDYSGADKIISAPEQLIYVTERARRQQYDAPYTIDPSIRYSVPGEHPSEYDKWLRAYESGLGFYPGVMSFGVVGPGAGGPRFDTFALIAMKPLLEALLSGDVSHSAPKQVGGGVSVVFLPLAELRSIDGCILYEE